MRIAILGTGKMGGAMAKRLAAAGHDIAVWNRTRSRAEALGIGTVAATASEAAAQADVVISSLTNAEAVRATYMGVNGAVAGARKQVFIEMSTAGPNVNNEIAPAIEHAGADFVEAPIVGSTPAVESGTALVLAAGTQGAIERARPVLAEFGEVRAVGEIGSAAILKLIANTMLGGVNALAAELMAAGTKAGLKAEDVFFIVNRFAPGLAARKAGFVEHRYEPVLFTTRDEVKDLNQANDLYRRIGASTPLASTTRELFERTVQSAADLDMSAINSLYEQQAAERTS